MMRTKRKKHKSRQKNLTHIITKNLMVVICIFIITIIWENFKNININDEMSTKFESSIVENNSNNDDIQANVEPSKSIETESQSQPIEHNKKLNSEEEYLLAKIAMAEAEGESLETKVLVILTVLNRIDSNEFPDEIADVLFQVVYGVYQFTPIADGRWYNVEPNEDCWEAVRIAQERMHNDSFDALYFESDPGENWHSMNLTFVCESDNMQFWK